MTNIHHVHCKHYFYLHNAPVSVNPGGRGAPWAALVILISHPGGYINGVLIFKIKRFPPAWIGNIEYSDRKGASEGGEFDRRNF